jgi:hypothetical protein
MRHRRLLPVLLVALIAAPAAASDLWFHLRVDSRTDGKAQVRVNVPVSLIEAALPLIPKHASGECRFEVDGHRIRPAEFRAALLTLRKSAEDTPVTLAAEGESLVVYRRADYVFMDVTQTDGARSVIRLPLDLAEAMVPGEDDEVDLRAAARALVRRGPGELMAVASEDATVRIWIDESNESR